MNLNPGHGEYKVQCIAEHTKRWILSSKALHEACRKQNLSLDKLSECTLQRMGNTYFFTIDLIWPPAEPGGLLMTQADVVLIMHFDAESKSCVFETTDKSYRVQREGRKGEGGWP